MRAGAGFRMALKTKSRLIGADYALQTAIEQGNDRSPQIVRARRPH